MAAYYLDTSALVKRYVTERGSSWVEALRYQLTADSCWLTADGAGRVRFLPARLAV